jgi:hypothetical protein
MELNNTRKADVSNLNNEMSGKEQRMLKEKSFFIIFEFAIHRVLLKKNTNYGTLVSSKNRKPFKKSTSKIE